MSEILLQELPHGAYLYGAGEAERRWTDGTSTYFLASGDTTSGQLCVIDETAPEGAVVPLHRHSRDPESMYVLEGEVTLYLEGGPARMAGPGAFAHFPAGSVHGFRVASPSARYLLMTNAHHGAFFRAISRPSGPNGAQPADGIDEETVMAACQEYEVEFIGALPANEP